MKLIGIEIRDGEEYAECDSIAAIITKEVKKGRHSSLKALRKSVDKCLQEAGYNMTVVSGENIISAFSEFCGIDVVIKI